MNIYEFNKVIYKGSINRDFYIYCLKKNIKLIKYIFINLYNIILSIIFKNKGDIYTRNKFKYLKEIKNLEEELEQFYKRKNKYSILYENKIDIIIDKIPIIFFQKNLASKIIGYELDENYNVNIEKYKEEVSKINTAQRLYIRNRYHLLNIKSKEIFVVNNNLIHFINKRKQLNKKAMNSLIIILISLLLTIISFCYTNKSLDITIYKSYFELKLFILNFTPILLMVILLSIITKRVHISFLINSVLILILGIANQTKVLYRDDVVKFEDILLLKEAMTMSERYDVVIKKYTILTIIGIIIIFFLLKQYVPKLKINKKKYFVSILVVVNIMIVTYLTIYKNNEVYDSVGDTSLINVWISTRQSQIRGLVYPFIHSIDDARDKSPEGYQEQNVKSILEKYTNYDIPEDKKINVISIMLEAYNDFSKFGIFEFNEDIYANLHDIQEKSISGKLVTTIFGGGTIVTERNFLTGYYDFPSFRTNTNSYVWYFKKQGYRTEAMHPIYGSFYNRASYNPNLGFDIYYNYENKFSDIQKEFLDDNDFFDYIIEGYNDSKEKGVPYFNFSVTYQNHGPYTSDEYDGKEYFFNNKNYNTESYNTINQYFSGIKKTDVALKKLIDYFEKEEEPVIVIFFGDHNPYLGYDGYSELNIDLDISTIEGFENYYETPYVIYANVAAKKVFNKDFVGEGSTISPIFLMNELFDYCNLSGSEYLNYMSDLKAKIDVISEYYYKEDGEFVKKEQSKYKNLIKEYNYVNYYYSRNFKK